MAQRLLDSDLTATHFDPEAATGALPDRCEIVVVGAGIVGASIAYHLAGLGHQVLVVERHAIASGTSWHAAGLVVRGRGAHVLTDLACASIDLYRELQAVTGVDVNLEQPGSLTLARTSGRLDELRYSAMVARHHGIPAEIVPPSRVAEVPAPAGRHRRCRRYSTRPNRPRCRAERSGVAHRHSRRRRSAGCRAGR